MNDAVWWRNHQVEPNSLSLSYFLFSDITKSLVLTETGFKSNPEHFKTMTANITAILSIPVHGYIWTQHTWQITVATNVNWKKTLHVDRLVFCNEEKKNNAVETRFTKRSMDWSSAQWLGTPDLLCITCTVTCKEIKDRTSKKLKCYGNNTSI